MGSGSPWEPSRPGLGRIRVEPVEGVPPLEALFAVVAREPGAFLLESSWRPHRFSRWSFLGARPRKVLWARGSSLRLREGGRSRRWTGNPFSALRQALRAELRFTPSAEAAAWGVPFQAGAVGFLGYDLCHFVERLPRTVRRDIPLPDLYFAFYDALLALDHERGLLLRVVADRGPGPGPSREARAQWRWLGDLCRRARSVRPRSKSLPAVSAGDLSSNLTRAEYLRAVGRAIDYIEAGDIFQVNLSQRFEGSLTVAPAELYQRLRVVNPAPFAAYIAGRRWAVVGSSPERFLRVGDGVVETCPIKGTRPRGAEPAADARLRRALLASEKDNAELTMIVDLERNDLGRVCDYGSVEVTEPRVLEAHPTVYHLVATVRGRLARGRDLVHLVRASFPGGSVTGAPKVRAMEIIDELEPTARNLYTGALGYIGYDGRMDLSIVIRTFLTARTGGTAGARFWFQVGGGIVADSRPQAEYQETLDKGRGLVAALSAADLSPAGNQVP